MGAPFEDQVIKFIGQHRPLKLIALGVAIVGVLSSAYKTIEPVALWLRPPMYRAIGVSLPGAEREKLGCAYSLGNADWGLRMGLRASGNDEKWLSPVAEGYRSSAVKCLAAFGIPGGELAKPLQSVDPKSLELLAQTIRLAVSGFDGALHGRDRLAQTVFQFSSKVSFLQENLMEDRGLSRASVEEAPESWEMEVLAEAQAAYDEASGLCPCKFPTVNWKTQTKQELLESAMAADGAMAEFLGVKY